MPSQDQINALKYFIALSPDGSKEAKRTLLFLLDASDGLTREVCVCIVDGESGFNTNYVASLTNYMHSSGGSTHLGELMRLMGTEWGFNYHYGDFDPIRKEDSFNTAGQFEDPAKSGYPLRYTFWLTDCTDMENWYSRNATLVPVTREELDAIDINPSTLLVALYPVLQD